MLSLNPNYGKPVTPTKLTTPLARPKNPPKDETKPDVKPKPPTTPKQPPKKKDDEEKDKQRCKSEIDRIKFQMGVVKGRYCDMLIDKHNLFSEHKKKSNAHFKHGSWVGHIEQYNKQRRELEGSIETARALKCEKYVLEEHKEWRDKRPPNNPSEAEAKLLNCPKK